MYTLDFTVVAGSSNTSSALLVATFQPHGALDVGTLPAPALTLSNDMINTYFKHLGNGFHNFHCETISSGFRGSLVFTYGGTVVSAVPINPQTAEYVDQAISGISITGDGSVPVDHNYGGVDNLTVMDGGLPVQGAFIRAFLASDYAAGNHSASYVKGATTTDVSGHWVQEIMLDPAAYTLLVYKPGAMLPTIVDLTVT